MMIILNVHEFIILDKPIHISSISSNIIIISALSSSISLLIASSLFRIIIIDATIISAHMKIVKKQKKRRDTFLLNFGEDIREKEKT